MSSRIPPAIVIMGVSGSGKTTVGTELAETLGWDFYDADHFHPQVNIDKMAEGKPLNDHDRQPWLESLQALIHREQTAGHPLIVACSALKDAYRQVLARDNQISWVHLKGSFELIFSWMQERDDHYMKADMLESQFATLEDPEDALVIDIDQKFEDSVGEIIRGLDLLQEITG